MQKKNIYSQTINIVTNCIGSSIEFVKIGCQEPVDLRKIAKLPGKSLWIRIGWQYTYCFKLSSVPKYHEVIV